MLAKTSPVLQILNEKMNVLTLSKEEKRIYDSRMKLKSDIVTISESSFKKGIAEGIEKGIEKGIAEGIEKGIAEVVRAMKSKGFSVKEIADILSIQEEKVESMK